MIPRQAPARNDQKAAEMIREDKSRLERGVGGNGGEGAGEGSGRRRTRGMRNNDRYSRNTPEISETREKISAFCLPPHIYQGV